MRWYSILALPLVLWLTVSPGCKLDDFATDAEKAALAERSAEVDNLTQSDQLAVQRILDAIESLTVSLTSGDPERVERALAVAQDALSASDASQRALEAAMARYGSLEAEVRKRAEEAAGAMLLPILPPPLNGPIGVLGIQGALMLGFDRSRKHMVSAAGAAARAKLLTAIRDAGKALGLLHTEPADRAADGRIQ